MKKDYRPVSTNDSSMSEIAFVEQYWTRVWDEAHSAAGLAAEIEKREEYRVMKPHLAKVPAGGCLLDGGCGLGEWTIYHASRGFRVVGLDISRTTIGKLQERFPKEEFVVGDIRKTEFGDNTFDAYFSWGAFEHFEDGLGAPLEEARRILKPGGYLFVSVPFQNGRHLCRDRRDLWRWDENYDRHEGYRSPLRFYQWRLTKPELKREFEIHGFRTLQVQAIGKWQGLVGAVRHDLGLDPDSRVGLLAQRMLRPFIPCNFVGHMILGVAMKA